MVNRTLFIFLAILGSCVQGWSGGSSVSYDGQNLNLIAENETYGQVFQLIKQQTGIDFEVPPEMETIRLPLVEIQGLSVEAALVRLLEASSYDYLLVGAAGDPSKIRQLVVVGKSTKVVATASPYTQRMNQPIVEDPFGGVQENYEDPGAQVDPGQNQALPQGQPQAAPAQGVIPLQPVPNQPQVQPLPGVAPAPNQLFPQANPLFPNQPNPQQQRSPF
ncbi:MAG: hypothetical protein AB1898_20335 [Acidobacteriota bacterium]